MRTGTGSVLAALQGMGRCSSGAPGESVDPPFNSDNDVRGPPPLPHAGDRVRPRRAVAGVRGGNCTAKAIGAQGSSAVGPRAVGTRWGGGGGALRWHRGHSGGGRAALGRRAEATGSRTQRTPTTPMHTGWQIQGQHEAQMHSFSRGPRRKKIVHWFG